MERLTEVRRGSNPVSQVVVGDNLAQTLGNGLKVATSQSSVGRKPFGKNE